MNKIIILLILSSIFLSSCGNNGDNDNKIEDINKKELILNTVNNEYSKYKVIGKTEGSIKFTDNNHSLDFKGINCENIIPFYENKINGFNNNIGLVEKKSNKYGLYNGNLYIYKQYIKFFSKGKDENNICLYGISLINKDGSIVKKIDEVVALYKNGIFQYDKTFGLESDINLLYNDNGETYKRHTGYHTSDSYSKDIISGYTNGLPKIDKYRIYNQQFIFDKGNVISYLNKLLNVITFIETEKNEDFIMTDFYDTDKDNFNFKTHSIGLEGIYIN